jgi:hypothetical protein
MPSVAPQQEAAEGLAAPAPAPSVVRRLGFRHVAQPATGLFLITHNRF